MKDLTIKEIKSAKKKGNTAICVKRSSDEQPKRSASCWKHVLHQAWLNPNRKRSTERDRRVYHSVIWAVHCTAMVA